MIPITIAPELTQLLIGAVWAKGLMVEPPSQELRSICQQNVQHVLQVGMGGAETRRESVREMLRKYGYKPAGRNKPAHEYLLRTVTEAHSLPAILNAVDWLNTVSLVAGLPISLLSGERLANGALIRIGVAGEKFVFNRSGQELDLSDLICVCEPVGETSIPLGTPIKDSMCGKIVEGHCDVVAFIYAPSCAVGDDELTSTCGQLQDGFIRYCRAAEAGFRLIRSPSIG